MKYKDIKTFGHRRSGTHYITGLISINFLNSEDYLKIYAKHKSPQQLNIKKNKNTAFFYIWRNFNDVSNSIFNMRKRFGLNENNYDVFLKKTYKSMYSGDLSSKTRVKTFNKEKIITTIGGGLKKIEMTPYEFWNFDLERWKKIESENKNVKLICYDDIINNFTTTMLEISKFLNSSVKSFKNIKDQIGWKPL